MNPIKQLWAWMRPPEFHVAAAVVGGAVVGGVASNLAAGSAASAQSDAATQSANATLQAQRESNSLQRYMYDTSRSDNAAFLQNGTAASNKLALKLGITPNSSINTSNTYATPDQSEANFNVAAYLAANPDVAQNEYASQHAYQHYLNNGKAEGRAFTYINAPQTEDQVSAATQAAQADPDYGSLNQKFETKQFDQNALDNDLVYNKTYQTALDQGNLAVNRLAAASGSLNSGATLKALQDRSATTANQYVGDAYNRFNNDQTNAYNRFTNDQTNDYNRLAGLSGSGQTAANTLTSAGNNAASTGTSTALSTGNSLANTYADLGNSRAASAIGTGNSINRGISSISNYYTQQNMLNSRSSNGINYGYGYSGSTNGGFYGGDNSNGSY
jgi:hypothetical protein